VYGKDGKTMERELSTISYQESSHSNSFTDPLWTVETIRSMARREELPAIKIGKVW
jgi:hypothetical protein